LLKREATPSNSLHGATMEEFNPPEIQDRNFFADGSLD
jgi:hypothetical protein